MPLRFAHPILLAAAANLEPMMKAAAPPMELAVILLAQHAKMSIVRRGEAY
jgi:hypothetical protein